MLNKVLMTGRVATAPKTTPVGTEGKRVCEFVLACEKRIKNKGLKIDKFKCYLWNDSAVAFSNIVIKGDVITIEGELNNEEYTNSKGIDIYTNVIFVKVFHKD